MWYYIRAVLSFNQNTGMACVRMYEVAGRSVIVEMVSNDNGIIKLDAP